MPPILRTDFNLLSLYDELLAVVFVGSKYKKVVCAQPCRVAAMRQIIPQPILARGAPTEVYPTSDILQ